MRTIIPRIALAIALLLPFGSTFAQQPQPAPQPLAVPSAAARPVAVPKAPELPAPSYLLIDYHSGAVLAEKNADMRVEPASLTKMMTAYVVFSELSAGHLQLTDLVTISEKAWRAEGSRTFVQVGSKVPVEVLLKGLIVQSGNDASIALAEHIAGNEETFAQLMNQYARKLGMNDTHFVNATGLPHPDHYTTARDLAKLAVADIRNHPQFYPLHAIKEYTWNGIKQHNRNVLLWRDPSVDGIKTGHTSSAGYCLAASAVRDGMRLVSILMGASSENARAEQTQALLNYGFRFFETRKLYQAQQALAQPRVWKGSSETLPVGLSDDLWVTFPRNQYDRLQASMVITPTIMAPIQHGAPIGKLIVKLDDQLVQETPLVALTAVEEGGLWRRLVDSVLLRFQD